MDRPLEKRELLSSTKLEIISQVVVLVQAKLITILIAIHLLCDEIMHVLTCNAKTKSGIKGDKLISDDTFLVQLTNAISLRETHQVESDCCSLYR